MKNIQYTLIIDRRGNKGQNQDDFYFKNFTAPNELIQYVSDMSEGPLKVYSIYKMDVEGVTTEMTIGFNEGQLSLIKG